MARKGWNERLKELGTDTQAELDRSKEILDRISANKPKKKEHHSNSKGTPLIAKKEQKTWVEFVMQLAD